MSEIWESIVGFLACLVLFLLGFSVVAGAVVWGMTAIDRANLKYNCQLSEYPGWRLALMIDDTPYAYEPEKFCASIRLRMETGK
jgi:hypothetical protein